MIWLNPIALLALAAVAGPILIHILVQRKAERFPFPTLRFIQQTRLAAIRRHCLEDSALLVVRIAILAAAVAALAGPLLLTTARRQVWAARVVRAIVVDHAGPTSDGGPDRALPQETLSAFRSQRFDTDSLPDGIRRAVAWLDGAPPARREIVVVSPFAVGAMTAADVTAIPGEIGVRLERAGALPAGRTVSDGRLFTLAGTVTRDVTLDGTQTVVRDVPARDNRPWPIDVVAPPASMPALDAAVAAVRSERVWAPPAGHRVRFVLVGASEGPPIADAGAIGQPWMADALAIVARDSELRQAGSRVALGNAAARFASEPWQTMVRAADGRPLVAAAGSRNQLIVASAALASDLVTPLLMRAVVNGLAVRPNLQPAEVIPIPDRQLREWTRPAHAPDVRSLENVEPDDRRWLWGAALALLALEAWIRRARTAIEDHRREETSRVA